MDLLKLQQEAALREMRREVNAQARMVSCLVVVCILQAIVIVAWMVSAW